MKKTVSLLLVILAIMALPLGALAEEDGLISKTTGLPTDHEYKPVTVQLDNEEKARPIKGISKADVVYEIELYNGGYTRYTAVFNDTIPELVEAVRSMRISNIDLYLNWGGLFVHYGKQTYSGRNAENYANQKNATRIEGQSYSAFKRDSSRKAPNNVYCNLQDVQNLKDYSVDQNRATPLTFSDDSPTIRGEDASQFEIIYRSNSYQPGYIYNEEEGIYYRTYNGNPHKDGDSGEQLTCSNVILMRVATSWYNNMSDAPVHELTGTGVCEYFIGGKHFTGTWSRKAVEDPTEYYDQDGNIVNFKPGKTFIQIAKDKVELKING